jgi:hypothetical protein
MLALELEIWMVTRVTLFVSARAFRVQMNAATLKPHKLGNDDERLTLLHPANVGALRGDGGGHPQDGC